MYLWCLQSLLTHKNYRVANTVCADSVCYVGSAKPPQQFLIPTCDNGWCDNGWCNPSAWMGWHYRMLFFNWAHNACTPKNASHVWLYWTHSSASQQMQWSSLLLSRCTETACIVSALCWSWWFACITLPLWGLEMWKKGVFGRRIV